TQGEAASAGKAMGAKPLIRPDLKGYRTGAKIPSVINTKTASTPPPAASRSSIYSTDIAKMTQLPIFHVNADDVEAAWRVLQIALDFRQKFNKDVVIDLIGFRRHGHNEGDEPSYTQPLMYQRVKEHPGVREIYTQQLIREGVMKREEIDQVIEMIWRRYENALLGAKEIVARQKAVTKLPEPKPEMDGSDVLETGVARESLDVVSRT